MKIRLAKKIINDQSRYSAEQRRKALNRLYRYQIIKSLEAWANAWSDAAIASAYSMARLNDVFVNKFATQESHS